MIQEVYLKAGKFLFPAEACTTEGRTYLKFGYNKAITEEIRSMQGCQWHGFENAPNHKTAQLIFGTTKVWSFADTPRNRFQYQFLQGKNPYARYDNYFKNPPKFNTRFPLREHQIEAVSHGLAVHYGVWAYDMGCIDGDAMVHVSRAGKEFKLPLSSLFYKFHGGVSSGGKCWDQTIPTYIRSLKGETLGLNLVRNVLHKGIKETLKLTLKSGKSVIATSDHEICTGYDSWTPLCDLNPGDLVFSNGEWVDTDDNRPENLELMSSVDHARLHGSMGGFSNLDSGINSYNGAKVEFVPHYDTVVAIEPAGRRQVFDVVCDDPHRNFVADGVVVHNCGKTLQAIALMELTHQDWWYVAPKSALRAVEAEIRKWGLSFRPQLMTYQELVKRMKNWTDGARAPQGVFFDESSRIKTPTAQRSEAAMALADGIRGDWGDDGFVILMSGTPAPKSPVDWWFQTEVACPGFIREGDPNKFKKRLGLFEAKESFSGGVFSQRVTWLDDERKCAVCGLYADDIVHSGINPDSFQHDFQPSVNEVAKLYRRMKGLVIVKMKKDCLDLPEKQYRIIECPILPSTIRTAKLIAKSTSSVAKSLILLRELSDGFQYIEVPDGEKTCELCHGNCEVDDFRIKPEHLPYFEQYGTPPPDDASLSADEYQAKYYDPVRTPCTLCAGIGKVAKYTRSLDRIATPKDDVLRNLLDEHHDIGRFVVYAGFEASVNRCVEIALSEKWAVVKWDGKGIKIYDADGNVRRCLSQPPKVGTSVDAEGAVEPLTMFQEDFENFPRVCFVGNAGAAGMGLTLTASPSVFFYSNDFNAENRIQAEERIHRLGMDENRGATVIDVFHLPTDKYVHTNLTSKRELQSLSMGEIVNVFEEDEKNPRLF